ncbi:MAG: hypothetical protein KAS32_13725 [Candidatus Peribacteraceae bacterium]|nr:hypothetical protein [Candidatus Peribacteraceae bacterium]
MSLRPGCVKCRKELKPLRNDVVLVHFLNNDKKQGIDVCHEADLWGCKTCDTKVVIGLRGAVLGMDITNHEEYLKNHYWIEVKR